MEQVHRQDRHQAVRSYATYPEAKRAVEALSAEGFPVEHLSIVAEEVQLVEDITGRRDFRTAAGDGLLSGALVGALIGFFFGLFSLVDPLVSALVLACFGVLFGAVIGGLFGVVMHFASGGRRDLSSSNRIQAGRYDVVADQEVAGEAASLLDRALTSAPGPRE